MHTKYHVHPHKQSFGSHSNSTYPQIAKIIWPIGGWGVFRIIDSSPNPLAKFWDHIGESDTRLAGHPLRFIPDYKNKVVPLRLHGDGMPAARGDSLEVLPLGSVVGL